MKKRKRTGMHLRLRTAVGLLILLILLIGGYQAGRWLETRNNQPEARGDYQQRLSYEPAIEVDGVRYRQRKDVKAILLMGIDQASDSQPIGYRNGGQADFLELIVFNDTDKTMTRLQIDRDTMTPVTVLGVLGKRSGVRTLQICLSHGFGDGGIQSCELTVEAVSNLLMGAPIADYIAVSMDGISVLNDAVGGVTVTLEDDFSHLDPAMTPGTTLTLQGEQAELFVRSRMSVGVGTNEARMVRQQVYMSALAQLLGEKIKEDKAFVGTLYDALEPYMVTSLSRGLMINTAWAAKDYTTTVMKLEGVHQIGTDGFMEFLPDESMIQTTVLELFYQKIE
ncbi:MAG: LCP family protein [Aristaeellaceae bacterium]